MINMQNIFPKQGKVNVISTDLRTLSTTATTDTYTFPRIVGDVRKLEIYNSATALYKVYSILSNSTNTAIEYMLGGASNTVATTSTTTPAVYYPATHACNQYSTAYEEGSNKTASRVPLTLNNKVRVDVSGASTSSSWYATIYYKP